MIQPSPATRRGLPRFADRQVASDERARRWLIESGWQARIHAAMEGPGDGKPLPEFVGPLPPRLGSLWRRPGRRPVRRAARRRRVRTAARRTAIRSSADPPPAPRLARRSLGCLTRIRGTPRPSQDDRGSCGRVVGEHSRGRLRSAGGSLGCAEGARGPGEGEGAEGARTRGQSPSPAPQAPSPTPEASSGPRKIEEISVHAGNCSGFRRAIELAVSPPGAPRG